MKKNNEYWRTWFDRRASSTASDYVLNRGTTLQLEELERRGQEQLIEALSPKNTDVVLDAGCGSGRNLSVLSSRVREIIGIDYSEEMLRRARERVLAEGLCNVRLQAGDVTKLEFATGTFDKAVCASVLQYLDNEDCALALREIVRVCKSGGKIVLHIKNGTSLYGLSLLLLRPLARLFGKEMKPEYYRSRAWHEKTLKSQGALLCDYDGFGIFTFVPLPRRIVGYILKLESALRFPKVVRKLAVNHKMTFTVAKGTA